MSEPIVKLKVTGPDGGSEIRGQWVPVDGVDPRYPDPYVFRPESDKGLDAVATKMDDLIRSSDDE